MAFTETDLERFLEQIEGISGKQDPHAWTTLVGDTWKTLQELIRGEFIETDIIIYATYNYDLLQVLVGQRDVDESHVDKIIKNVLKKWYRFQVGQVNQAGEVIDMQHRAAALKRISEEHEIKLPAFIVIVPDAGRDDVVTLNSVSLTWQSKHFLQSWMNSEKKEVSETYSMVSKLIGDYNLPHDLVITMIGQRQWIWLARRDGFKNWQLTYTKSDDKELRTYFDTVFRINTLIFKSNKPTTRFISACNVLFAQEWFDFSQFIDRVNVSNPHVDELRWLSYQSAERIYELCAQVYNYRSRNNRISESWKTAKKWT